MPLEATSTCTGERTHLQVAVFLLWFKLMVETNCLLAHKQLLVHSITFSRLPSQRPPWFVVVVAAATIAVAAVAAAVGVGVVEVGPSATASASSRSSRNSSTSASTSSRSSRSSSTSCQQQQ